MIHEMPFGQVLEAAGQLSLDEQTELIAILHRRLAQAERERLVSDLREAREEFAAGACKPTNPADLLREIKE
ncbi:MAG: hypothetical protein AB7O62_17905 [Pirellulales bacterium]